MTESDRTSRGSSCWMSMVTGSLPPAGWDLAESLVDSRAEGGPAEGGAAEGGAAEGTAESPAGRPPRLAAGAVAEESATRPALAPAVAMASGAHQVCPSS